MYHLTFITQTRYTGAIFNEIEFYNRTSLVNLMWVNETSQQKFRCEGNTFGFGCRSVKIIDAQRGEGAGGGGQLNLRKCHNHNWGIEFLF
jgi:hypothetical protein